MVAHNGPEDGAFDLAHAPGITPSQMSEQTDRDGIPEEALERLIGVLLWNQMNPEAEGASLEDVARKALGAVLGYIDEYCPEWYGRQWLRPEEMAALLRALG